MSFPSHNATMASKPTAQKEMLRFVVPLFLAFVALPFLMDALPLSRSGYVVLLFLLWIVLAMAIVFVMYFFRDPERALPPGDNLIVSAADGLVVGIDEMEEPDFHLGPMIRISVFLSVFDVHVNRAPCESTVKSTVYKAGKFLDVRHPQSSRLNECRSWRLETPHGDIAVRQIAGLIARRIVAWAGEGSKLARGQRFGMIRFGSRTEVFLPAECAVLVQLGDRVQGAATPIARWPETG